MLGASAILLTYSTFLAVEPFSYLLLTALLIHLTIYAASSPVSSLSCFEWASFVLPGSRFYPTPLILLQPDASYYGPCILMNIRMLLDKFADLHVLLPSATQATPGFLLNLTLQGLLGIKVSSFLCPPTTLSDSSDFCS